MTSGSPSIQRSRAVRINCTSISIAFSPHVHAALVKYIGSVGAIWAKFSVPLHGMPYLARRLAATDLAAEDPFKLLATGVPGAAQDMRDQTLALIGADFGGGEKGFVLLAGRADLAKLRFAHAANLLDHSCKLLGNNRMLDTGSCGL